MCYHALDMEDLALPRWPVAAPAKEDFSTHHYLFASSEDRAHGLWLTEAGYHRHLNAAASRGRVRPDWTFLLIVWGRGFLEVGERRGDLVPGDVLVLPTRRKHTYGCTGRWSSAFVHFDGPRAAFLGGRIGVAAWPVVRLRRPAASWNLLRRVLAECGRRRRMLQPLISSLFAEVLVRAGDDWRGEDRREAGEERLVGMLHAWMAANLDRPLTLRQIASKAGFSPAYFSRMWKSRTGHSPVDYLIELRLQKARELLAGTHQPIAVVAELSGFADPLYFSKVFRARIGLPPSIYREQAVRGR